VNGTVVVVMVVRVIVVFVVVEVVGGKQVKVIEATLLPTPAPFNETYKDSPATSTVLVEAVVVTALS
jgi:hypothetical protein